MSRTMDALLDDPDYFIMDMGDVVQSTGLPADQIFAMIDAGTFPAPSYDHRWYAPDVHDWLYSRFTMATGASDDGLLDDLPF